MFSGFFEEKFCCFFFLNTKTGQLIIDLQFKKNIKKNNIKSTQKLSQFYFWPKLNYKFTGQELVCSSYMKCHRIKNIKNVKFVQNFKQIDNVID